MVAYAGRPEKPLDATAGPLVELAAELRRLREKSGLTYRELAVRTGRALSTLTAAAAGQRLPSWPVTHAWTDACNGDKEAVLGLYERACAATGRPAPGQDLAGIEPPDPAEARTPAEYNAAMVRLQAWAGHLSLRTLNRRSGGRLPPSTVCETLRRERLPRHDLMLAFIDACGIRGEAAAQWERSWTVISRREHPAPARATEPVRLSHAVPGVVRRSCLVIVISLVMAVALALTAGGLVSRIAAIPAGPVLPQGLRSNLMLFDRALAVLDNSRAPVGIAMAARPDSQTGDETYTLGAQEHMVGALGSGWESPPGQGAPGLAYLGDFGQGPVLILTGLPTGTVIGQLGEISGQSYDRCAVANHWISATIGAAAILPGTRQVCIITAGMPSQAALMTVQGQAQQITLRVTTWKMTSDGLRADDQGGTELRGLRA